MNKQFEHRGYNFNIKVELNTKVEKRLDGERWHTVVTNCLGVDNYYKKELVKDSNIETYVQYCERLAKKYVDDKLDKTSTVDKRLTDLGFK